MIETSIKVENIKKSLKNRSILEGVSFNVNRGDVFGFVGPNGAGKTTTIRVIMGLYQADSGETTILGQHANNDYIRNKIGFVLDKDGLFDEMSAEANLAYYLKIYGKPADKSRIKKALSKVGLNDRAKDKIGTYSKGMRQRASLARSIVHDPEILILDEPTSGVDPSEQMNIRDMLTSIAREDNKTVFLSSHNMDEVQKICNRVALLNKGKIQLYGELKEIRKKFAGDSVIVQISEPLSANIRQQLLQEPKLGFQKEKNNQLILSPKDNINTTNIVKILSDLGIGTEEIKKNEITMEDIYSKFVKESDEYP